MARVRYSPKSLELLKAAKIGDDKKVRQLLEQGAAIDAMNSRGQTPLVISLINEHKDIARLLIERGCNVNLHGKHQNPPIFIAIEKKDEEILELMLDGGSKHNVYDLTGITPLMRALKSNSSGIIELLLEKGADPEQYSEDGYTPLMYAIKNCKFRVIRQLLSYTVRIDGVSSSRKETALHMALELRRADVCKLLIESNASTNIPNIKDDTAVHIAARNHDIDSLRLIPKEELKLGSYNSEGLAPVALAAKSISGFSTVKLLLDSGATYLNVTKCGESLLDFAARQDNLALIAHLLAKYSLINYKYPQGLTVLESAIQKNLANLVTILLRNSTVTTQYLGSGHSLITYAIKHKAHDVAKCLVNSHSVDVNLSHQQTQETALYFAAENQDEKMVEFLLNNGAKPNVSRFDGTTPLMIAIEKGAKNCVLLLIRNGANLNKQNFFGVNALINATKYSVDSEILRALLVEDYLNLDDAEYYEGLFPLYYAVKNANPEHVRMLIEAGADVNKFTHKGGKNPLLIAAREGNVEITKLLLDAGASIDRRLEMSAYTALFEAIENNKLDVVSLLLEAGADASLIIRGRSSLLLALEKGASDIAEMLLSRAHNLKVDYKCEVSKQSPLILAVQHGFKQVVKILLAKGVDAGYVNPFTKQSALKVAVAKRSNEMVKALLEAQRGFEDESEMLLIGQALKLNAIEIARMLINVAQISNYETSSYLGQLLFEVVSYDDFDMFDMLIANGANLRVKKDNEDIMANCIRLDKLRFVERLLDAGVDPCLVTSTVGFSSIALAVSLKKNNILRVMLDRLGDDRISLTSNMLLMQHAAARGDCKTLEILLDYGYSVNGDVDGSTVPPIVAAIDFGGVNNINFLIRNGAALNISDFRGNLLNIALNRGIKDMEILTAIIASGVDIDEKCFHTKFRPINFAIAQANAGLVKELLRRGASIEAFDEELGYSPLMQSIGVGNLDVIEVLLNSGRSLGGLANPYAASLLKIAILNNRPDVVRKIIELGLDAEPCPEVEPALHLAVLGSHTEIVEMLAQRPAFNLNYQDAGAGFTALTVAITHNNRAGVEVLARLGADPNIAIKGGYYCLSTLLFREDVSEDDIVGSLNWLLERKEAIRFSEEHLNQALRASIIQGNYRAMCLIIDAGADVNQIDEATGRRPLCIAAEEGEIDIVDALITRKADYNLASRDGRTALSYSAMGGNLVVFTYLLSITRWQSLQKRVEALHELAVTAIEYLSMDVLNCLLVMGIDINKKISCGRTLVEVAADSGNYEIFKRFEGLGETFSAHMFGVKYNPLIAAVKAKDKDAIALLGTRFDDPDRRLDRVIIKAMIMAVGDRLHEAASQLAQSFKITNGIIEADVGTKWFELALDGEDEDSTKWQFLTDWLVNHGFNPRRVKCSDGATPLMRAIASNHDKAARHFIEIQDVEDLTCQHDHDLKTALHLACEHGNSKIVEQLLQKGVDYALLDSDGKPAVYYAIKGNHLSALKSFIRSGAGLQYGSLTVLNMAIKLGSEAALKTMLVANVSPNLTNSTGVPALYNAVECSNIDALKMLLIAGANPNLYRDAMFNPLNLAVKVGRSDFVVELLNSGADAAAKDEHGDKLQDIALKKHDHNLLTLLRYKLGEFGIMPNPLMSQIVIDAMMNCNKDLLKSLLRLRVFVNHETSAGELPIVVAAKMYDPEYLLLLVDGGADLNMLDRYGNNALGMAIRNFHINNVKYLLNLGAMPVPYELSHELKLDGLACFVGDVGKRIKALVSYYKNVLQSIDTAAIKPKFDLHYCVKNGNEMAVKAMLASGLNPNKSFSNGVAPLVTATIMDNYNIARSLIMGGAHHFVLRPQDLRPINIAASKPGSRVRGLLELLQTEEVIDCGAKTLREDSQSLMKGFMNIIVGSDTQYFLHFLNRVERNHALYSKASAMLLAYIISSEGFSADRRVCTKISGSKVLSKLLNGVLLFDGYSSIDLGPCAGRLDFRREDFLRAFSGSGLSSVARIEELGEHLKFSFDASASHRTSFLDDKEARRSGSGPAAGGGW